ncbi:hypothetical protein RSOLAG1IB_09770 [Rhizoctonia solani AG-1 IB]|uniref:Retrotransposon gag domain-containing protein n=1 Tax=Thanatephorus cucumeris (strain AG1-IB / isolate 7/3/14) TaxID=1108050 RepID=M5C414_THACB|nr:hypothetical protein BN14_07881 [Rhizoctonia solani AG-1 IB]CEL61119.1 hypothetical protein RSOLAG1IB_09770 [Rhizoctonia solani AG-1 IB]
MSIRHSPLRTSCTRNSQSRFTTSNPSHPYAEMATNSRPASQNSNRELSVSGLLQEADQGPALGVQSALPKSIQWLVILLTTQVANLSQQIRDRDQDFQDLQAMVKETNQAVGKAGPTTPEVKPGGVDVHQTPRAFGLWDNKPSTSLATAAAVNPVGTTQQTLPGFALPQGKVKPPPSSHLTNPSRHSSHSPSANHQSNCALTVPTHEAITKVKVKAQEPFKGGLGADGKQWLAHTMGWLTISGSQSANNRGIIMFLLINMEGMATTWALPHIALVGERRAVSKTADDFQKKFRKAFDNLDTTAATECKITKLVQTTTATAYTAYFRTLQLEIDWNQNMLWAHVVDTVY